MPVKSTHEKAAIYDTAIATMADALHDACKKYLDDVEGALILFVTAIGLTRDTVTEDDLKWAVEQVRQIEKQKDVFMSKQNFLHNEPVIIRRTRP